MVDIELLLATLFQSDAGTIEAVPGGVWVELPEGVTRPCARMTAGGGREDTSDYPVWLNRPVVNFDVWGATKSQASTAVHAIRDALLSVPREQPVQTHGEVTRVTATYPFWLPDEDFPVDGRPGPRYLFTARLTAHPTRT
jgi:hypothetical protein